MHGANKVRGIIKTGLLVIRKETEQQGQRGEPGRLASKFKPWEWEWRMGGELGAPLTWGL